MNYQIITLFVMFFVSVYVFYKYKIYNQKQHITAFQLFSAFGVLLTAVVLYDQLRIHVEEVRNQSTTFYQSTTSGMFDDIIILFMRNPDMTYFYNELYDGIIAPPNTKRNKAKEQMISLKICSQTTTFTEYYYSHRQLGSYDELVEEQKKRILRILTNYLRSPIFRTELDFALQNFAGDNLIRFMSEFFNINVPRKFNI